LSARSLRPPLWAMVVGVVVWLGFLGWARPLSMPDEGRYVGVAWGMVTSGEWLTPALDGLPYFHKPPLFYWLTAASMSVFGAVPWAARLAPLLGASAAALALYLFTRRWATERAARWALLALLLQPLFYIGAQFANMDMLVAGCISATVLLLADAALRFERGLPHRQVLLAAGVAAGCGVLAKGLIGIVLPALTALIWLAWRRQWRSMGALMWPPGWLAMLVVAAPWFTLMQGRFDDFLNYFFVVQHFKRFASTGFNNVAPFWFYPALLAVCSVPGWPWLWRSWRGRGQAVPVRAPDADARAVRQLMWVWMLVVVVFFSLPKSKLIGYVLPACPPLAWFIADGFTAALHTGRRGARWWRASLACCALLCVTLVLLFTLKPIHSSRDLGLALRAQHQPGEPVFMLSRYVFDVPFYARLTAPAGVVDDWGDPEIDRSDNGRKELSDAGRFLLPAQAERVLVRPEALLPALCKQPVSWVIGPADQVARWPVLAQAQTVLVGQEATLWRVDAQRPELLRALGCAAAPGAVAAQTPSPAPAGK
jgi:4-amino-4-deoxy-L-arabinose transferase-like glycosyltransferase